MITTEKLAVGKNSVAREMKFSSTKYEEKLEKEIDHHPRWDDSRSKYCSSFDLINCDL